MNHLRSYAGEASVGMSMIISHGPHRIPTVTDSKDPVTFLNVGVWTGFSNLFHDAGKVTTCDL